MSGDISHREFCKRQHRVLAAYLAVFAWRSSSDFVVAKRRFLEQWLRLERFRKARVRWLLDDVEPWFPFHAELFSSKPSGELASIYLSRRSLESENVSFGETMRDEDRVALLRKEGISGILLNEVKGRQRDKGEITAIHQLNDIAAGLSDLAHFKLKRSKKK